MPTPSNCATLHWSICSHTWQAPHRSWGTAHTTESTEQIFMPRAGDSSRGACVVCSNYLLTGPLKAAVSPTDQGQQTETVLCTFSANYKILPDMLWDWSEIVHTGQHIAPQHTRRPLLSVRKTQAGRQGEKPSPGNQVSFHHISVFS